jgi:hypothetical protein
VIHTRSLAALAICRFPIILGISVPVYATVRTMVDRDIAMADNQSPSRLDQLTFRNLDTPMREDSSDSKLFPSWETEHRRNRAPASQDGDH